MEDIKSVFNKIKFFTDNKRTVAAMVYFDGKRITATAKCDPRDTFDFNKGRRLARAKLRVKLLKIQENKQLKDLEYFYSLYHGTVLERSKYENILKDLLKDYCK